MEIKRILKQYAFCLIVICCVSSFFYAGITVRERTQYNMDMTSYDQICIEKADHGLVIRCGEKESIIRSDFISEIYEKLDGITDEGLIFDFRKIFA